MSAPAFVGAVLPVTSAATTSTASSSLCSVKPAKIGKPEAAFFKNAVSNKKTFAVEEKTFTVSASWDPATNTGRPTPPPVQKKYSDGWGDIGDSSAGNDQLDIRRGRGMVDSRFQGKGVGAGSTHVVIQDSIEYYNKPTRTLGHLQGDYYIAPAFMDKIVVHLVKNMLDLPKVKVPLILGIWGGKGQGKTFQTELVFKAMGIEPIVMSSGELEDASAGEPAKLIRQRYREAADQIKKGKMCCLLINDLDAGAGRMGHTTQYTVNNQMVNATLMNIADNPTNVQMPGMYNMEAIPRVPIIVTGNDFSTLYAPLIRDGRMEKYFWQPTREDRVGVCFGIFKEDGITEAQIETLVDTFPSQSIDFFGAMRSRLYDDIVRDFVESIGVGKIAARLVNSIEKLPEFQRPRITLELLIEYGHRLQAEQALVQSVKLADSYMSGGDRPVSPGPGDGADDY